MSKKKILNDPIYGFISFPFEILYDLIDHPFFQRLRRISQMGLSHYIYPGAIHSRFHHALGALHLMVQAITVLKEKGIKISDEEAEAVCIAILLHDIGHGPFSHALENILLKIDHEGLSLSYMQVLNVEFKSKLSLAIKIFKNEYHRAFFHQLISGQLDLDRMDYLKRDSFFTGVAEGVIGHDRIIKMLNVKEDQLVVEEKGIYSVEKFLLARRLMYWQVYLHKTSIAVEQMLIQFIRLFKENIKANIHLVNAGPLRYFLEKDRDAELLKNIVVQHALLDDFDIYGLLKSSIQSPTEILRYLSESILNRKLFKIELHKEAISHDLIKNKQKEIQLKLGFTEAEAKKLILLGTENNQIYSRDQDEIKILKKNGNMINLSEEYLHSAYEHQTIKHYICYPKLIQDSF